MEPLRPVKKGIPFLLSMDDEHAQLPFSISKHGRNLAKITIKSATSIGTYCWLWCGTQSTLIFAVGSTLLSWPHYLELDLSRKQNFEAINGQRSKGAARNDSMVYENAGHYCIVSYHSCLSYPSFELLSHKLLVEKVFIMKGRGELKFPKCQHKNNSQHIDITNSLPPVNNVLF